MSSDSEESMKSVQREKSAPDFGQRDTTEARVSTVPSDVYRVGVRIAPFCPDKPMIWFAQLEGQFLISNITADTTKFYYNIVETSQLDNQYAAEVEDIIVSSPATNKYEKLKSELIKRLSASKEKKVKQLFMHEELGDRKPSQFLRHLQHLAGPGVPEDFVRTIWTSRLPHNMQQVIASQASSPIESLADLADRIQDIAPPAPTVASTSSSNNSAITMEDMAKQIAELTRQVKALTAHNRSRSQNRSNYGNRNRSRSNSRYRKQPLCWYYAKFVGKARKCITPCDFKAENSQGSW
ncbi:uncharacterized protein LOC132904102 [Amyelois transitella]|uniref:uncharacterized protein LOC132904102 n=1 Tax=Amyelois transitella TaxID=680683 RepID=UPI00299050AB|nr:uncharacterized protein LOC132904102 [Amyelois transitella]